MLPILVSLALQGTAAVDARAELVGWYRLPEGRSGLVTFGADGGLRLFEFEQPSFDVLVADGDGFRWQRQHAGEARLVFTRKADGQVEGFTWTAGEARGTAAREDELGYGQEEVRVTREGVELVATLLEPRGAGPHPGVVVIQGSGASDRDNVWAFAIAHHLARTGNVVWMPDKRGSGRSGGDWKVVGFDVLARDARAGFEALLARPAVDARRVGFVGLSQGGWIAPLAARDEPRAAFAASISSAAVPVRVQLLHELEWNVRGEGGDDEAVAIARELMEMAFAFGASGRGWEDYLAGVEAAPAAVAGAFPRTRDDWRWAFTARIVDFDPVPLWQELTRPCLVVYGAEDEHDNVPVAASIARLAALGRANLTVRVHPGSGHALDQPDGSWIRRDFLDELAAWIERAGR